MTYYLFLQFSYLSGFFIYGWTEKIRKDFDIPDDNMIYFLAFWRVFTVSKFPDLSLRR
jgi:hypothetical protein